MEYRSIKRCEDIKKISALSIGTGGMQDTADEEIEHIVRRAIVNGINMFDLCAGGKNVFKPFGRAVRGVREKLALMMHFGAGFDELNQYEWIRDLDEIRRVFVWQLKELQTDYADIGMLHCVDDEEDLRQLRDDGILDYMLELRKKGTLRHIGFSTHSPGIAEKVLDMGIFDAMMLPINPADDWDSVCERAHLVRRCNNMGVGVIAMRVFQGGRLLREDTSALGRVMTEAQCLQYALDRTGVVSAVVGVNTLEQLDSLLRFENADARERDYSFALRLGRIEESVSEEVRRPSNVVDIFAYKKDIAK